jgi:hypothetical protein
VSTNWTGYTLSKDKPLDGVLRTREAVVASQLEEVRQSIPSPKILYVDDQSLSQHEQFPLPCTTKNLRATSEQDDSLTGCFDYIDAVEALGRLNESAASRLVCRLVRSLAPRGTLLVSSFTPEALSEGLLSGQGKLQCRTEWQMAELLKPLTNQETVGHAIWRSEDGAIVYLEVRK